MPQLILFQTPTRGVINLAYIRQVCFREIHIHGQLQFACLIIWSNGDKETFVGKDAQALAKLLR
ncbi:MAG: hypothetical protein HXY43_16915 [Fischerella sp.]|jgi:hypothetical protein|uniref:hypothetical protein n=1 Tax=Fischerella sp. TaxID=1191 RepID=UPI0017ADC427|nr:hypothetical protein [Fischerella sp.]NWF60887.1 hypothetical protein [Fischerella sp.]